jgi:hypothetical protein
MLVSFSSLLSCILALSPVNLSLRYVFATPILVGPIHSHPKVHLTLNCSTLPDFSVLWSLLTSHSSLLLQVSLSVRPHGISHQSFLVYLPNLPTWVTVTFWTSLLLASSSAMQALVLDFCSSGYDFAIASSLPHLTMWNLQVALGFVGNYAPCGLSPQIDGMPVILKSSICYFIYCSLFLFSNLFNHDFLYV